MVVKWRSRNNRRTKKRLNKINRRTIKRVRNKKYSRKKKTNVIKRNKKQFGGAVGGQFLNRIGFELEACFVGESIRGDAQEGCTAILDDEIHSVNDFFGGEIKHFDATMDESIECNRPLCKMEMVLSEKAEYTYAQGGFVYANGDDIKQELQSEILLIVSKAKDCINNSCGFHVHMSDTRPHHTLNDLAGKKFLLNTLALWCGIEGSTPGEQNTTFQPYIRENNDYARINDKLDKNKFIDVYSKAIEGSLNNIEFLDYLISLFFKRDNMSLPLTRLALNIYFLSDLLMHVRATPLYKQYLKLQSDLYSVRERLLRTPPRLARRYQKIRAEEEMARNKIQLFYSNISSSDYLNDIMVSKDLWNEPLRVEFRGHKDLMDTVMSEVSEESENVESVTGVKRFVRASVFYEKLTTYLDTINDFFERAKVYDPLSAI